MLQISHVVQVRGMRGVMDYFRESFSIPPLILTFFTSLRLPFCLFPLCLSFVFVHSNTLFFIEYFKYRDLSKSENRLYKMKVKIALFLLSFFYIFFLNLFLFLFYFFVYDNQQIVIYVLLL